jgi:hypothetical protein
VGENTPTYFQKQSNLNKKTLTIQMLQLLQQLILLIGCATGAITDAKTGYIYDYVTIPMIVLGIILSILQMQWTNLIVGTIIFILLYITYKLGKIGGGDVKLFASIALLNPYNDYFFLVTTIFFAAMSAMVFYAIYYFIKYARVGINLNENKNGITKAIIFGIIIIVYFGIMVLKEYVALPVAELLTIPIIFGLIFIAFQEGIKKNFFEKKIALKDLEDDEVIAEGRNLAKVIELLKGKQLIGEKEIQLLKKHKITSIYVLRGLPPFGPFILLGVLAALAQPNFLSILFL